MNEIIAVTENDLKLTQHFIAYFDILGYKKHVQIHGDNTKFAKSICDTITTVEKSLRWRNDSSKNKYGYDLKLKVFSDNFIICSESNWYYVIAYVNTLQLFLIRDNIFIRGALYYGDLHFHEHFIYGQGIIDTYDIESQIAIFPRVVVNDKFIDAAKNVVSTNSDSTHKANSDDILSSVLASITDDFDGCKFADYLKFAYWRFVQSKNDDTSNALFLKVLSLHQENITKNIKNNVSNMRILQKYQWCKNYHNNFCKKYKYTDYIIKDLEV